MLAPFRISPDADQFLLQPILAARARLRVAEGQAQEAAREWSRAANGSTPGRSRTGLHRLALSATHALDRTGEHERARQLAAAEAALAEPLGEPRTLGIALHTLALVAPRRDRIDLLQEATAQLERSLARLEHARALTDYGARAPP